MSTIIALIVYLGIGSLLHAVFIGSAFDWSSAWTYGLLLGWPVVAACAGLALLFSVWALATIGILCIEACERVAKLIRAAKLGRAKS